MPWEVRKSSDCPPSKPWGVYNKQTGRKVACHASESDAKAQQRALYARVPESRMSELAMVVKPIKFAEFKDDGLLWVEALPARSYQTTQYGEVVVTKEKLDNFVRNFKGNVRGQEVATDYEHGLDPAKGNKASGWYRDFKVIDDTLHAGIELTPTAKKEIEDREWKYFSLDWEDYWPDNDGEIHQDVVVGGGFTNRPIAKNLMPINFSELYDEREGGTLEPVKNEHAAEEHTEPGGEPDPETNKDDSFPDRHPTLPADSEKTDEEGRPVTDKKDEEDMEKELREKLGLAEDADIIKAVDDLKADNDKLAEEVGPLREVAKQFSERKKFAEQYPEQAAELERLIKDKVEGEAIKFSETIGNMRFGPEGKHGFTQVVLDKVANTHKKFSEGIATKDDFEEVLAAIGSDKALVEVGEKGSERTERITFIESENPRMAFSEAVKSIMDADKLEYDEAVRLAAEKHPELAEAYNKTLVRNR